MARDCTGRPSFYGGGAWGPLPNRGFPGSEPGESTGGGPPAVEAHCVEPVSVGGSSLSGDVSPCPSLLSGQWALALLLSPGWICFTIGCNPV